ncbi:unnamed protein product [Lymnaea stagnalis]|uniref:EGF-like domain-containing protein n=1 Tax=Lymnaea stagnalis TaxID=6523 RepID=A0AAV2IEZ7_LYMST
MTSITDGDDTTCASITGSNLPLNIYFVSDVYFTWLRIIIGNIVLQKESVSIQFPDDVRSQCSKVFVNNITMDIYCNISKPISHITLDGSGLGTLCSLYISQGRNVALMQSTTQTSNYEFANTPSSKAVDGSSSWERSSCAMTSNHSESAPTWSLDFKTVVSVTHYNIFNRVGGVRDNDPSCCLENLKGFILRTFDQTNKIVQNYTDTETSALAVYTVLSTNPSAPVSTVQITATHPLGDYRYPKSIVTLCEVEIYGDSLCLQNKYGRDCQKTCNCAVPGEKCFVSTGNCPSGCKAGFYGQGCTKGCDDGYFGVDCRNKCHCTFSTQLCEPVDGNCTSCALKGKKLPSCTEDCDPGFYGIECKWNCSKNCLQTGSICDVTEGKCFGCKPGFYGSYCTSPCSSNCRDSVCDINSGICFSCKASFQGDSCDQATNILDIEGDYGKGLACGVGIGIGVMIAAGIVIGIVIFIWFKQRQKPEDRIYDRPDPIQENEHPYHTAYKSGDGYDLTQYFVSFNGANNPVLIVDGSEIYNN